MLYFSHPSSLDHDPGTQIPGHPEAPGRLEAIEGLLAASDWLGWERRQAPGAAAADLELIHSNRHVEAIHDLCRDGGGRIDADTCVGEASFDAALHAVGGACEMTRALLGGGAEAGFAALRPPGHHAEPERAMGFCLFDSVAIAAAKAISALGARRVFVLDWDVHHGNGTAEAFRNRDDVLYASIHQGGIYPGTGASSDVGSDDGEGYTLNLPVPAGSDGEQWLSLLSHVVLPIAVAFDPDLVLISAGFDAHRDDPLASCNLTSDSFARMAGAVRAMASGLRIPVGAVLEGGYHPAALAESVRATLTGLAGGVDPEPAAMTPPDALAERAAAQFAAYWPL